MFVGGKLFEVRHLHASQIKRDGQDSGALVGVALDSLNLIVAHTLASLLLSDLSATWITGIITPSSYPPLCSWDLRPHSHWATSPQATHYLFTHRRLNTHFRFHSFTLCQHFRSSSELIENFEAQPFRNPRKTQKSQSWPSSHTLPSLSRTSSLQTPISTVENAGESCQ